MCPLLYIKPSGMNYSEKTIPVFSKKFLTRQAEYVIIFVVHIS